MKNLPIFFLLVNLSFLHANEITTVQHGDWFDRATWSTNKVPAANEQIKISHQITAEEDVVLEGTTIEIEASGQLDIAGYLTLRGMSELTIQREGLVKCGNFKNYTTAGTIRILGTLECGEAGQTGGIIYLGGIGKTTLEGQLFGTELKLRGAHELHTNKGTIDILHNATFYGNTRYNFEQSQLNVAADLILKNTLTSSINESSINIGGNVIGNSAAVLNLSDSSVEIDGVLEISSTFQVFITDRSKLAATAISLAANSLIQGQGEGGLLECQTISILNYAQVRCASMGCQYDQSNDQEIPKVLDLGDGIGGTFELPDVEGLQKSNRLQMSVFPNPTADVILIQGLEHGAKAQIQVSGLSGQSKTWTTEGKDHLEIALKESFAPGIYQVSVRGDKDLAVFKVILQ